MKKTVQIEFADPRLQAIDCFHDLQRAADSANLNLISRFGVKLEPLRPVNGRVFVDIQIPDHIADGFAIGRHLRGVSRWLLAYYPSRYTDFLVGKRLLGFKEVDDAVVTARESINSADALELIVSLARLLKRTDEAALTAIETIRETLENAM